MARFKTFLADQKIECAESDWKDPQNQADMRSLIGMEMQNVAFGMEAGFRFISGRDPQVKKALDIMPDAESLLKRKQVLTKPSTEKSLVAQQ
jgi:carboxyl-terminal processing protease